MALSPLKPVTLLKAGSPTLLVGLTLLVTGMWTANLIVFVIGTVVTGIGTGLIFRGALSIVSDDAPDGLRAEVLAGFFLSVYVGLAVPAVALGFASGHASARTLMLIFVLVVAFATTVSVRSVVRRSSGSASNQKQSVRRVELSTHFLNAASNNDGSTRRADALEGSDSMAKAQSIAAVHPNQRAHRPSRRVLASATPASQIGKCVKEDSNEH
jgi:MFS family permease